MTADDVSAGQEPANRVECRTGTYSRPTPTELERGVLVVRSQLVEVGDKVIEGKPKTRSGEDRRVDIGQRTIGALLAHRLLQDAERQWAGY